MSTDGKIDAAALARREDRDLTEIAQIAPGNTAQARELLVNENIPASLLAAFEAAADSARYVQTIETFNTQQQQRAVLQQQAAEKKEKEQRDNWLEGMSAEYKQAYGQLMTTVDKADSEYDQLRHRLKERGDQLDQEAQEIDEKSIHLSDGSRAYLNGEGVLVDKNGVPLKGKAATEAKAIAQQRNGDVSSFDRFHRNEQSRGENHRLAERVDSEQSEADKFKKDVADGKVKDTKKVQESTQEIKDKLERTKQDAVTLQSDKNVSGATKASFSDLEDDSTAPAANDDRGSVARKVDDGAGIKANDLTAPFKAAAQGADPAPAAPTSPQKPTVAGPSPH